jgi:hypothetical protein
MLLPHQKTGYRRQPGRRSRGRRGARGPQAGHILRRVSRPIDLFDITVGQSIYLPDGQTVTEARKEPGLEARFTALAEQWKRETRLQSSIDAKVFHPCYQKIIGMGPSALPLIFSELRARGGHWYWALQSITGENPAAGLETIPEARRAWIEYGVSRNFIAP